LATFQHLEHVRKYSYI